MDLYQLVPKKLSYGLCFAFCKNLLLCQKSVGVKAFKTLSDVQKSGLLSHMLWN